jgi:hypothetical protein
MGTDKDEAALARRRAQNREAQRRFRREYRHCSDPWDGAKDD